MAETGEGSRGEGEKTNYYEQKEERKRGKGGERGKVAPTPGRKERHKAN